MEFPTYNCSGFWGELQIDLEKLAENVEQHPDWYQKERANHFGVSQPSIWAALKELHISHKKNAQTSSSRRSVKS